MGLGRARGAVTAAVRGRPVVTMVAVAALVAACGASVSPDAGAPAAASGTPPTCTARVTPDCTGYTYTTPSPGTVVVTAPPSSGGNNREFFWARQVSNEADSTVCATFASGEGIDQQGVVVRLNVGKGGGVSGITVTRNIWGDVFDVFNFHLWNTAEDPASPFTQFGSTLVSGLPVRPELYPLNICARTVSKSHLVEFVVWAMGQERPGWGSTDRGGEAEIPAGAPATGRGGWFAGHLVPGTSMRYANLTVDGRVPVGLP